MRNGQAARGEAPAAPRDYVEVEHPLPPAPSRTPPKLALDRLERGEHRRRIERAFHQSDGVGEFPSRAAYRLVEDDWRRVEQAEAGVEAGDGGGDDARRTPVPDVAPVRTQRDRIEVELRQKTPFALSLSKGCPFFPELREGQGFDKLSPNGWGREG